MSQNEVNECGCENTPESVKVPVHGLNYCPELGMVACLDKEALKEAAGGIDYSLEEQWTGRRWIDGKKIYQKTLELGGLSPQVEYRIPHGISQLAYVVSHEGFFARPHPGYVRYMPLPYVGTTPTNGIYWRVDGDVLSVKSLTVDDRPGHGHITLFYTCTDR